MWGAKDLSDVRSKEGLWRAFKQDVSGLKQELDTYFKPAHQEVIFAQRIFKMSDFLDGQRQDIWHGYSSLSEKDARCAALREQKLCEKENECVWDPKTFSLKASCKYRPLRSM